MRQLLGVWLTLLIFLSGPALEGKVRFDDFTIAAETTAAAEARGGTYLLRDAETGRSCEPVGQMILRVGRVSAVVIRSYVI
jgi:hypothetical protein